MTWQITVYFGDGQKPFVIDHSAEDRKTAHHYARQWFQDTEVPQEINVYDDGTRYLMFRPEHITRIEVNKGAEQKQPILGSKKE